MTRIYIRRDIAENWISVNPILAEGEQGFETDTKKMKVGDGYTAWINLSYISSGAESFIGLSDVPSSYSGEAGNAVVVKADETGLEFVPATGTGDMTKAVYDPTGINASPFNADNHISGTANKVYTALEQLKVSQIASGAVVSGSNTGDNAVNSNYSGLFQYTNAMADARVVAGITGKVDKETGKGLSTNDYTTAEKNKLAGINFSGLVTISVSASEPLSPVSGDLWIDIS